MAGQAKQVLGVEVMECQRCAKEADDVIRRRQKTSYVNDESNFAILCDECQKEADDYWQERWDEYYAGCM